MWKINLKAGSTLGRYRSALLLLLAVTIVVAAVIAIVGVLTQFGDQMWKVVSTFGITALIAFAMLLQTFSLSRERLVDRANVIVGAPVAAFTSFAMVDASWDSQLLYRLLGSDWDVYGKVVLPIALLTTLTAAFGLLLNVRHHPLAVRTALASEVLAVVVWLWSSLNAWFPKLFTEQIVQSWGISEEPTRFWQSFIIIAGILLGAAAVLTFVLELVGLARARAHPAGSVVVTLPAESLAALTNAAQAAGKSAEELAGQLLTASLRSP